MRLNKIGLLACVSVTAMPRPFEPNGAGWKTDENGAVTLQDGNPVYIDSDGQERVVAVNTISNLIGENKQYRSRAQTAEQKLDAFKDIDPEAARNALDIASRIDQKKLLDAGKVDEIKAEIEGRFKTQLEEATSRANQAQAKMEGMMLDTAFSTSKFVADRVAIPSDLIRSAFGNHFKIEDGKVVPYGADGKPVYSNEKIGEIASFDEALSILINSRPDKDKLLLAKAGNGSGNSGAGGNGSGSRVVTRAEFDALPPLEKGNVAAQAREGKIQLVD